MGHPQRPFEPTRDCLREPYPRNGTNNRACAICADDVSGFDDLTVLKGEVGDVRNLRILVVLFHSNHPVRTLHSNIKALQLLPKHKLGHILRDEECVGVSRMSLERVEFGLKNLGITRCDSDALPFNSSR